MLKVDISDVRDHARAARKLLRAIPREMTRIVANAAKVERRTHAWTNRTGNLERGTVGRVVSVSDGSVTVELAMLEEYASYVWRRGFSAIDDRDREARNELDFFFAAQGKSLE